MDDHYIIPPTHILSHEGNDYDIYVLCPNIIKSEKIRRKEDIELEKLVFRKWSYKFEFMNYLKKFFDTINEDEHIILENQNLRCPFCDIEIKKFYDNRIYSLIINIPTISCYFSPFILHMIFYHDYKPPEKFIEYILQTMNTSFIKFDANNGNFFKVFDDEEVNHNFKYIEKKDNPEPTQNFVGIKENIDKQYVIGEVFGTFEFVQNFNKIYDIKKIILHRDKKENLYDNKIYNAMTHSYCNLINFHTHPNSILTSKDIEKRVIKGSVSLESPSFQDIRSFINMQLKPDNKIYTDLIFCQNGIYQILPKINFNPYNITEENIEDMEKKYILYLRKKLEIVYSKVFFIKVGEESKKIDNFDYHMYNEIAHIRCLKSILDMCDIDLIFYPKEINSEGEWVFGDIYIPVDLNHKNVPYPQPPQQPPQP